MAVPPFHALYAAGFLGAASPSSSHLPWPSPRRPGLGSLLAPFGGKILDAAGFASCCGPAVCTLLTRARPRASTPRSPHTSAGCYEGPWLLLRPDFHRQVIVDFQDTRQRILIGRQLHQKSAGPGLVAEIEEEQEIRRPRAFERRVRVLAVGAYRLGKISRGRLAEILGLDFDQVADLLQGLGISTPVSPRCQDRGNSLLEAAG